MAEKICLSTRKKASKASIGANISAFAPGMYIGKLGDGSSPDDGIYVLLKEVLDNCIDEHTMGFGRHIDITIEDKTVTVRDYGRGIPLGKVVDVVSKSTPVPNMIAKHSRKVLD